MRKPKINYLFVSCVYQHKNGYGFSSSFMTQEGTLNLRALRNRIERNDDQYESVVITFYDRLTKKEYEEAINTPIE